MRQSDESWIALAEDEEAQQSLRLRCAKIILAWSLPLFGIISSAF